MLWLLRVQYSAAVRSVYRVQGRSQGVVRPAARALDGRRLERKDLRAQALNDARRTLLALNGRWGGLGGVADAERGEAAGMPAAGAAAQRLDTR